MITDGARLDAGRAGFHRQAEDRKAGFMAEAGEEFNGIYGFDGSNIIKLA